MNYLRKNAKIVMVFMCVVCMITFVVGYSLIDLVNNLRARQVDESQLVVVSWTKGALHEPELANLHARHRLVCAFLYNLIRETIDRGGSPVVNGQQVRKGQQVFDIGIPQNDSDEAIVETMLLAEEARRMGIAVDRDAVKSFLHDMTYPELREGDWVDLARDVVGTHFTVDQLLEHLGYELRAQHVRVLSNAGLLAVPPAALWDYFNRLNRRVTIEAFPIEVAPLVTQVKAEPSAAELQTLFEEGKFRDPNPNIAEPGFHRPHKVAFGYLRVEFAPFLEEAKKQITDQQIEDQYKKDVGQGLHKVLELPDKSGDDKKKEDGKAADDKDKKEGDKPAEEKKQEVMPPGEKPTTEKGSGEAPKTGTEPKSGCDTEAGTEEQATTGDAKAKDKPADEKKGEDKKADNKKADDEKKAGEEKKAGDEKPAEKGDAEKPAETKAEPKFKPLSEVRDEILTRLAQPIAQEAKNNAVKKAMDAINNYGRDYRRWQSVKNFKQGAVNDPGKLELEAIAAKNGFKTGSTPLVDRFEVAAYDIGREVMTFDLESVRRGDFRMQGFADIAFGEDETLYSVHEATSMLPDVSYIYFRTDEVKPADPKLDDPEVKKQVVEFWKKQRAFDLAVADAQKLAAKAKGAVSLAEVVSDKTKVVVPAPFAWMSMGAVAMGFGEPELSRVEQVELAGREFMQAVFALKPGEAGAAPNQSHAKVYVVRMIGQDPKDEVLRQQFLDTGLNFQVMGVAQREMMQIAADWYREVEKRYQVTWHRPPRQAHREAM
jgi:hypothetical protein